MTIQILAPRDLRSKFSEMCELKTTNTQSNPIDATQLSSRKLLTLVAQNARPHNQIEVQRAVNELKRRQHYLFELAEIGYTVR
jgi:hypothetical protein